MANQLPDDQLPPLPPTDGGDSAGVSPVPPVSVKVPTPPISASPQPLPASEAPSTPDLTSPAENPIAGPLPPASQPTTVGEPMPMPGAMPQPMTPDATPAVPMASASVSPTTPDINNEQVIAPPQPEELPVEENFPGQPIPPEEHKKLEVKAEKVVGVTSAGKAMKTKRVIQGILGALALLVVGGGVLVGTNVVQIPGIGDTRQQASNAGACSGNTTQRDCNNACSPIKTADNKSYKCTWNSNTGSCRESGQECGGGTTPGVVNGPVIRKAGTDNCYRDNNQSGGYDATDPYYGVYCGGCVDGCVEDSVVAQAGGCGNYVSQRCGTPQIYGAACSLSTAFPNGQTCNCNGATVYFDKKGFCDCPKNADGSSGNCVGTDATHETASGGNYGLCGVYLNTSTPGMACQPDPSNNSNPGQNYSDCFSCSESGCGLKSPLPSHCSDCFLMKYTCDLGTTSGTCTNPDNKVGPSTGSLSFDNNCGTVQQIDVACEGVGYVNSRSRFNPECENPPDEPEPTPTPTLPPQETLACVEIASSVNAPKLGDSVRFTCSGTTSPGSIHHYNFQYKAADEGRYMSLAAESVGSAQSAPLVISEPGTYTVRCQACKSTDNTNCSEWQTL